MGAHGCDAIALLSVQDCSHWGGPPTEGAMSDSVSAERSVPCSKACRGSGAEMKEAAASGPFALSAAVGDQREWNAITRLGCVSTRYGPRQLPLGSGWASRSGRRLSLRSGWRSSGPRSPARAHAAADDWGCGPRQLWRSVDGVNRSGGTPPPRQCKRRARR